MFFSVSGIYTSAFVRLQPCYILPMRRLIIISGPRDSGKTRCVVALADKLHALGIPAGGVIAEAEIEAGHKIGYAFRDVITGKRAPYAIRRADAVPGSNIGYAFLDSGLEFGREALRRACAAGVAVLLIDEIGPLEIEGRGLWEALKEATTVFAGRILLTVRPSLVGTLCEKLGIGEADVTVLDPAEGLDFLP
jgi:nucleoside-triphosphatase THEP1